MADNGSAGNVFRDRRGENPFQPVQVRRPKVRQEHSRPERPIESYNGQGARGFNGRRGYSFNGFASSRQSPDEQKRFETEIRLGLRREKEA